LTFIVKRFKFALSSIKCESKLSSLEVCPLKEEQFKVLKTMSEATNRMDINMFAKKVNLNPNQTIQQVQELAKEGFLQKVGNGFGITEKGKVALKAFTPVPEETGFRFYCGIDQPTDLTARTLEEFYRIIKQVSVDSLEFHLYRGDFENWLKEACKVPELAEEIGGVKVDGLKGEKLRAELLKVLDAKYSIQELL
jgi:predicted transcriptional regulator